MTDLSPLHPRAQTLLEKARAKGVTIATAESCTGGLVAGLLTEIAGSSDVVERGFVTYSNQAKTELLGVPEAILAAHGAVSAETARAMVEGVLAHAPVDLAAAITGIAGPDGATPGKPVGTVFVGIGRKGGEVLVERHEFPGGRDQIRTQAAMTALGLLEGLARA